MRVATVMMFVSLAWARDYNIRPLPKISSLRRFAPLALWTRDAALRHFSAFAHLLDPAGR
jgi:hypothetical protein